jgi:hypothetical protein
MLMLHLIFSLLGLTFEDLDQREIERYPSDKKIKNPPTISGLKTNAVFFTLGPTFPTLELAGPIDYHRKLRDECVWNFGLVGVDLHRPLSCLGGEKMSSDANKFWVDVVVRKHIPFFLLALPTFLTDLYRDDHTSHIFSSTVQYQDQTSRPMSLYALGLLHNSKTTGVHHRIRSCIQLGKGSQSHV